MFQYGIGLKGLVHAISTNVRITAFIIDETVIQFGNQHFWLRICIESRHKSVLGIYISKERNILVAEKFIRSLVGIMENILYIHLRMYLVPRSM
jgi:hypothetical protein